MSYDDLIHAEYPKPSLRPRMPMSERAKIFMPFAALKGYAELLKEKEAEAASERKAPCPPDAGAHGETATPS